MDGYDDRTYGDAFADVYDEWYEEISDIDTTVSTLLELAGAGPVLELGVGTGRIAVPLAVAGSGAGLRVAGIDTSDPMLQRLRERDQSERVQAVLGSMVDGLPDECFSLIFVAYNTLFNLRSHEQQSACLRSVARHLEPDGRFVVEAFVPDDSHTEGSDVSVRSMTADRVVLSISRQDPARQLAEGQFIELTESGGVRLRPWSIRYAPPDQLDAMAAAAGLEVEHRWSSFAREPFDADARRHVTVYRPTRS